MSAVDFFEHCCGECQHWTRGVRGLVVIRQCACVACGWHGYEKQWTDGVGCQHFIRLPLEGSPS